MSKIQINTNSLWDIGKTFERIQNETYQMTGKLKAQANSLNILEDILQWSDEKIKSEANQMNKQADRCGLAASYIFKIAENYESSEKSIIHDLSRCIAAITTARTNNDVVVSESMPQYSSEKFVDKMLDNTTIKTTQEKKKSMAYVMEFLIDEGYEMAFIAGVLGNILNEGVAGKFESSAYIAHPEDEPAYLLYVDSKYDYRKKYSGRNIKDMSLREVYSFICELEKTGYKGKFGIGSVQWTGSRAKTMIELYMEIAAPNDRITEEQIMKAEAIMVCRELESKGYRDIYEKWKNANLGNLDSSAAAESAGELVCKYYERPKDTSAYIKRGDDSAKIYNALFGN